MTPPQKPSIPQLPTFADVFTSSETIEGYDKFIADLREEAAEEARAALQREAEDWSVLANLTVGEEDEGPQDFH